MPRPISIPIRTSLLRVPGAVNLLVGATHSQRVAHVALLAGFLGGSRHFALGGCLGRIVCGAVAGDFAVCAGGGAFASLGVEDGAVLGFVSERGLGGRGRVEEAREGGCGGCGGCGWGERVQEVLLWEAFGESFQHGFGLLLVLLALPLLV